MSTTRAIVPIDGKYQVKIHTSHYFAISGRFEMYTFKIVDLENLGQKSRSTVFSVMPGDGKCQSQQKLYALHFALTLAVSEM